MAFLSQLDEKKKKKESYTIGNLELFSFKSD